MSMYRVQFILITVQCLILTARGAISEHIIDTECSKDDDCREFVNLNRVANATCFNRHCICKDSDFQTIQCLPQTQGLANVIGAKCPCTNIKWSSCVDGFCMCNADFLPSEDRRNCIPKTVPIGSSCENNNQCSKETSFAKCINSTCSCQTDFFFVNGSCHSLIEFRNECHNANSSNAPNVKCGTIPNTICEHKCFCKPGFVATFDRSACIPNVNYNDGCLESVQCQFNLGLGGVCERGKCVCGEDFSKVSFKTANETEIRCENRIAIGQMCGYDTDCFQSHSNGTEQSMHCYLKECQCAPGYELDPRQIFCVESINAELQSTWFDSLLTKVTSAFSTSGSDRIQNFCYLLAVTAIYSIISNV